MLDPESPRAYCPMGAGCLSQNPQTCPDLWDPFNKKPSSCPGNLSEKSEPEFHSRKHVLNGVNQPCTLGVHMCPMDKNKKFQSSPVYKSKRLDTAQMPARRRRDKYIGYIQRVDSYAAVKRTRTTTPNLDELTRVFCDSMYGKVQPVHSDEE